MTCYPDTSFLCALYRLQENSPQAAAYFAAMAGPLEVTTLLLYEFRQSALPCPTCPIYTLTKGIKSYKNSYQFSLVENFQIPLNPPFSKGEKALWFIEFPQIGSPPFDKGRTGGISGKAFSKR